jgi:2-polyprenyl-3-methyl-5-hydroxy-6-metoxy-1,4-benzoquinol methylase
MTHNHKESKPSFDEKYSKTPEIFGHPYQELQDYFQKYPKKGRLLDLGSGQGRDSIFLASIGYQVTAIDSSKVGVSQMLSKTHKKGLKIKGIIADVLDVQVEEKFDIILFDMLLHTFEKHQQIDLLKKFSGNLRANGIFCIVFPNDMNTSYFMKLLNSLQSKRKLTDEITIRDVPKLPDEEDNDFTFTMIVVKLS